MIGVEYYGGHTDWWSLLNHFVGFKAFHHSNGQDSSEFDTQNPGEANIFNGNFGEQVVFEVLYGGIMDFVPNSGVFLKSEKNARTVAKKKVGKRILLKVENYNKMFWKIGYEFLPQSVTSQAFDLVNIYGRYRININAGLILIPELWELVYNGKKWCDLINQQ